MRRAVRPVFMVESGPAAGVIASAYLGETLGRPDILSFDMGGTTAKVGLIQGGRPSVTKDYNVGGHAGSRDRRHVALRLPGADAGRRPRRDRRRRRLDRLGRLGRAPPRRPPERGRRSGAGLLPARRRRADRDRRERRARPAQPGATSSAARSGSTSRARRGRSRSAAPRPLGLTVTEAANGIVEIANAAMVNALHLISVQRGYDPRDFVLVGFGGAGPVHANALARDAEMPTLLIPRSPGIFSATGLLTTDLKRDTATTIMRRLDDLDHGEVATTFAHLEEAGRAELEREGLGGEAIEFLRQIDLRYVGQSYELTIPAGDGLLERFHAEHDRTYGFSAPGRARRGREPAADEHRQDREAAAAAARRRRGAGAEGAAARLLRRGGRLRRLPDLRPLRACRPGRRFAGPAVVEEFDSTTVVHPGLRGAGGRGREPDHREGGSVSGRSVSYRVRDRPVEERDGADAGRRPARLRHLPARARRRLRRGPLPDDHAPHAVRQDRQALQRDRRLLRPEGLQRRADRPARPLLLRGVGRLLPRRHAAHGSGRLRHLRVDRRAAVVERPDRHRRQLLRRDHAGAHRARARRRT